ncbi:aromatic ring-opening dioxygenase LigA [Paraoerskovia marina]|uniref:aromatic ring-opening dioxygenase LigA n=1 Tax=Paraoerskovia marina TaxID=545619 RepID=UPI0031F708E8
MSSTVTVKPTGGVRAIGMLTIIAGIIMILAGGVTWYAVHDQLAAENITVSDDADFLPGDDVDGPFSAYAQADIINHHALESSGGKTYAELEQDDPTRTTVMTASFLRASLFTSVVAFGVAALVIGLGIMFILLGVALRRLAGGSEVSVDTSSAREPAPAATAPAAAHAAGPATTSPGTPAATAAPAAPAASTAPAAPAAEPRPVTSPGPEDVPGDDTPTRDAGPRH